MSIWEDPHLSPKIRNACAVARANGYRYIWIDSCCIDKSRSRSETEISDAINSMYEWYSLADVCYAYLADVCPNVNDDYHADRSPFRMSQWFRRGWTLQELIAPSRVEFLSKDWSPIGSKHGLFALVESITKIHWKALLRLEPLDAFSVAQRLSWAAERETTMKEDRAYSLLGIFDINMPTLYGEGERAFRRLQEQIMQRIPDQSLLAWGTILLPAPQLGSNATRTQSRDISECQVETRELCPRYPLAQFLYHFKHSNQVKLPVSRRERIEYTPTPYGIRTELQVIPLTRGLLSQILGPSEVVHLQLPDQYRWYLAILGCEHARYPGHLLGRVYAILPSDSGVDFVYTGRIRPNAGTQYYSPPLPDLFLVSPGTMKHYSPIERKTVYIPHLGRADQTLNRLRNQPYPAIKLALLEDTSRALHSRGYSANLRDPVPDRPTTHCLTLSKDDHIVTVKFEHTLEDDGKQFTMTVEVTLGPPAVLNLTLRRAPIRRTVAPCVGATVPHGTLD